MTNLQLYNLFAGLTVLFIMWGSLGFYAIKTQAREAEERRQITMAKGRNA